MSGNGNWLRQTPSGGPASPRPQRIVSTRTSGFASASSDPRPGPRNPAPGTACPNTELIGDAIPDAWKQWEIAPIAVEVATATRNPARFSTSGVGHLFYPEKSAFIPH